MANARHFGEELQQQGQEVGVDENHLILGVLCDIGQLGRVQSQVQRVQHRAHAGDSEVRGDVVGAVPAQGRDDVTTADAKGSQGSRESAALVGYLGKRAVHEYAVLVVGHGRASMDALAVLEQVGDAERVVLHRGVHGRSPFGCRGVLSMDGVPSAHRLS